jgi:putative endopeptidase
MVRKAWLSSLFVSSLFLSSSFLFSQSSSLHGIDVSDLDRKADPCTDFFEFANGTWRANNPIPASMTRWSKRWAAGESSKDKLRDILEAASSDKDAPKGSTEQIIGDYIRRLHGRVPCKRTRHGSDQTVVRQD